jgi:carbonic anhydrase/acetyltransferase-like protein (isoleucine patch superfamily)
MLEEFSGFVPRLEPGAWAHPSAVLIGDVVIGAGASVWPVAVLRGDMGPIRIGAGSNVQDGTICHDTTDRSETVVGERVTIGHRAILHGCRVGDDCLIGMGAILMDNVVIGAGSFVAAGTLLPPGKEVPPGSFVMGSPGRVVRPVGEREIESIAYSWEHYRERASAWLARTRAR